MANDFFIEKDIKFYVLIAPNKEIIYSEYMPENIHRISTISKADKLVDYLRKNTKIECIYPKDELLKLKAEYQLYYKYDTHWNQLGGFIGVQKISEAILGRRLHLDDISIVQDPAPRVGDLANMVSMGQFFYDDHVSTIHWFL